MIKTEYTQAVKGFNLVEIDHYICSHCHKEKLNKTFTDLKGQKTYRNIVVHELATREWEEIKHNCSEVFVNQEVDNSSWVNGKSTEKIHPDGTIEFKHTSHSMRTGKKRGNEPSTFFKDGQRVPPIAV
jgi:hypothetical protein